MLLFWIFGDILSLNVKMYLWLKLYTVPFFISGQTYKISKGSNNYRSHYTSEWCHLTIFPFQQFLRTLPYLLMVVMGLLTTFLIHLLQLLPEAAAAFLNGCKALAAEQTNNKLLHYWWNSSYMFCRILISLPLELLCRYMAWP